MRIYTEQTLKKTTRNFLWLINIFGKVVGQKINTKKSVAFLSTNDKHNKKRNQINNSIYNSLKTNKNTKPWNKFKEGKNFKKFLRKH